MHKRTYMPDDHGHDDDDDDDNEHQLLRQEKLMARVTSRKRCQPRGDLRSAGVGL